MKRLILAAVLFATGMAPVFAERYLSNFGFSVEIPSHWTILSRKVLQENSDLFSPDSKIFAGVDPELLEQMKNVIRSGRIEIYFNADTSTADFGDNINIYNQPGRIPGNASELRQLCSALPGELRRAFSREIVVHRCELRKTGGLRALLVEFDGVVQDTRSVQYQVVKGPGDVLIFTLTAKKSTLASNRRDFDAIVDSIIVE